MWSPNWVLYGILTHVLQLRTWGKGAGANWNRCQLADLASERIYCLHRNCQFSGHSCFTSETKPLILLPKMDYAKVVKGTPTVEDYRELFTSPLDRTQLESALQNVSSTLADARGPQKAWQGIFRHGIVYFANAIGYESEEEPPRNAVDYQGSVPEEDITQQSGITPELPEDDGEDITQQRPGAEVEGVLGKSESEKSEQNGDAVASEDLSVSSGILKESVSVSRLGSIVESSIGTGSIANGSIVSLKLVDVQVKDPAQRNQLISQTAQILNIWFAQLLEASRKHKTDFLGVLFGLPGTDSVLTEKHLGELLTEAKWFIDQKFQDSDWEFTLAIKEIILLLHQILRGLFHAVALERDNQTSNRYLIVKSLLFTFYKADLSRTLDTLLSATNSRVDENDKEIEGEGKDEKGKENKEEGKEKKEEEENKGKEGEQNSTDEPTSSFRLSYNTLMHIYTIYDSLANIPINMLLVDKVSLSLDITTLESVSANAYLNLLNQKDFKNAEVKSQAENRMIPLLCALYNYNYQIAPDLLRAHLHYSSFFSWITGHTFAPDLYLGIDTISSFTNFKEGLNLDIHSPFLHEVEEFEVLRRQKINGPAKDSETALRSPTYLALALKFHQLSKNESFVKHLTSNTRNEIQLLDIWLAVLSYVHHYQYKSPYNKYGARISLLTLVKLTSTQLKSVKSLRDHKINEFKWKLCHQKQPPIPITEGNGEISSLLYIMNLVQVTLRFNLTKKLDLDNCKLALTILYQILLEGEQEQFDDLQLYKWQDLYKNLVHFIKFVAKNCNEEGLKYVIEEVFAIFDVILGPTYDKIIERSSDFWTLGSHVVKSVNFDLFYEILQHHQSLQTLYDKYIIKRENFPRVEKCFASLAEKFDLLDTRELNYDDVTVKLNELSLLSDEEPNVTNLDISKFNYAETFKYLDKYHDYNDFDKEVEIVDVFNLLYDNDWTPEVD